MAAGAMTENDLPMAARALLVEYGLSWLPARPGDPPGLTGYLYFDHPISPQDEETFRTRWRACWPAEGALVPEMGP